MGVITAEPPYHAQVWEYLPWAITIHLIPSSISYLFFLTRFYGMCESMTNSKNKKLEYQVKLGNQDCRTIIARNIRVICDKWKVCEKQLWNKWKNGRMQVSVYSASKI